LWLTCPGQLTTAGYEDNLIFDLAAKVGALLIVSDDADLLSMPPWRGIPVIEPIAFAA
jgi:predicted nucleic acid-binding protein